jgi:alpha-ribazole phosphatase/probable phosphoglycerate mutase
MPDVYLLRHGETQWNADGNRYCGRTDIPLTKKGIAQAESVRNQLKDISFEAVYSSPLQRSLVTAQIACGGRGKVITDQRLIEVDFGNWEGKTRAEFVEENASVWNSWCDSPDQTKAGATGETAMEVISRLDNFYGSVLEEYSSGNILVTGHNGVNRLYLAWKLGMPLKNYRRIVQENSSVTLFSLDPETHELTLQRLNSRF